MPSLGEQFRAAREARGLTLSEVSEQIRIRSVYLSEIEAENWSAIGAPVYIRGFLRTYARFLGLDPEEAVGEFNKTQAAAPVAEVRTPAGTGLDHLRERSLSPLIWVATAIAAILIGFVIYNYVQLQRQRAAGPAPVATPTVLPSYAATASPSSPAEGTPGPSPSGGPLASAPPAAPHSLALTLSAPSWLRVVVDGNVSMEGTFPAGTAKEFRGKFAVVRVGNAGGVQISVNGKPVGKLGAAGDVVERTFTL